jgi:hypothetical protein
MVEYYAYQVIQLKFLLAPKFEKGKFILFFVLNFWDVTVGLYGLLLPRSVGIFETLCIKSLLKALSLASLLMLYKKLLSICIHGGC